MNKNFRSAENIIEFTNAVFENIMTEEFAGIDYKNDGKMIYKDWEVTKGGEISKNKLSNDDSIEDDKKVEVHIVCEKELYNKSKLVNDYNKELSALKKEKEDEETITANIVEAEFIASKIERLVKEDNVHYSDIVVLFRSFYSRADIYLEAFKRHNIPVYAQMKKGFFDRMEIRLMIDILNIIDNEQQDIPVANVLCSNIFGVTNNEIAFIKLAALSQDKGYNFISSIRLANECLKYIKINSYEEKIKNDLNDKMKNIEEYYNNKKNQINKDIDKIKDDNDNKKVDELKNQIKCLESEKETKIAKIKEKILDLKNKVKSYREFASTYGTIIDFDRLEDKLSRFIKKFEDLRTCARYYSISELIEKIYEDLDVKNIMLSMNDGIMRTANLDELYELANRYEATSFIGLFNFLRYIEKIKELKDDQGLAQVLDENDNVVRIMSIHQSKGLEFNYVFVSGCGSIYNTRDSWDSNLIQTDIEYGIALDDFNIKENYCLQSYLKGRIATAKKYNNMKEEMRMLYVAITRAKKRLFVTAAVNGGNNGLSFKKAYETYIDRYDHHLTDFQKDINFNNVENKTENNQTQGNDSDSQETKKEKSKIKTKKISELNTYIDLILSSITKGSTYCDIYSNVITINKSEDDMITRLKLQDILDNDINDKPIENSSVDLVEKERIERWNDALAHLDTDELNENIDGKYNFDYLSEIIKPKFSVSEIKKEHYDSKLMNREKNKDITSSNENDSGYDSQNKTDDEERKDSTNIGNIYHTFMQFYNFDNPDENKKRFDNIVFDEEKDKDGNIIDRKIEMEEKISKLSASDFGKAFKGKKLYREYKFMQLVSQNEINKYLAEYGVENLPNIDVNVAEKNIVIQGIVDAFYIDDDDEIVVIDWKTDGIKSGRVSKKELIDNYQVQLDIYAKVLNELTGLKVKKRYIYSFTLNEAIELNVSNK